MSKEITCPKCKGEGKVGRSYPKLACPKCNGHGKIYVPDNYKKCPVCEGRGTIRSGYTNRINCHACNGLGWSGIKKYE